VIPAEASVFQATWYSARCAYLFLPQARPIFGDNVKTILKDLQSVKWTVPDPKRTQAFSLLGMKTIVNVAPLPLSAQSLEKNYGQDFFTSI
jgi:hypothetical protein